MSTRSFIARVADDGSVTYIYCHWDGYPSHNGALLAGHYQDPAKVDELLALGNLSVLRRNIGEKHPFDRSQMTWVKACKSTNDDFAAANTAQAALPEIKGEWCVAYGRDRGEEDSASGTVPSLLAFVSKAIPDSWAEWVYLFENGQWMFSRTDEIDERKPVTLENVRAAVEDCFLPEAVEGCVQQACKLAGWKSPETVGEKEKV